MGPPKKVTPWVASSFVPLSRQKEPNSDTAEPSLLSPTSNPLSEPSSPSSKAQRQTPTTNTAAAPESDSKKPEKQKKASTSRANDDAGIDDLLLPRTLISRLARGALPPNTSIQRDALLALTKSATVFISYLAHTANGLTSRKTIQSQDILDALKETELWNYNVSVSSNLPLALGEKVQAEVERWEGEVRGKRKGYRERVKARESGEGFGAGNGEGGGGKRVRREVEDGGDESLMTQGNEGDDVDIDTDMAASQLQAEAEAEVDEGEEGEEEDPTAADGTETDPDPELEEEEDEEEENEEDEDEAEVEEEDEDARRDRLDKEDETGRRRTAMALAMAPNGRVEGGSEDEDGDESD